MTGHARRTDPLTSYEAAGSVDIDGRLFEVWHMMSRMENERSTTWDEAKEALPDTKQDTISPRFKTLVKKGYAFRIEVDRKGNEIGYIVGDDVNRKRIRYKTRHAKFSRGRQLINYWKMPGAEITRPLRNAKGEVWTPPPRDDEPLEPLALAAKKRSPKKVEPQKWNGDLFERGEE